MGCGAEVSRGQELLAAQLSWHSRISMAPHVFGKRRTSRRMLKKFVSKTAGESKPEAYPQGYVEDFDEPRTTLRSFFSTLLCR